MNSSIALRLLWKEYRMQRGLWLAMAFGCFLIQAVISQVMQNSQETLVGMISVVTMLTFFYTIGSGAITFAIEREEGTQIRPVMLSCPAGLTLTLKVMFGVFATILLFAATACSGLLLAQGSFTLPPGVVPKNAPEVMLPVVVLMVALLYLGAFLWSMFFSLLTRTVILALGLALIAMIASYIFVVIVLSAMVDGSGQSPTVAGAFVALLVPGGVVLLLLLANFLLTHRWMTQVFFDQRTIRSPSFFRRFRLSRSALDGGVTVEIGGEDRTAFEVIDADIAAFQPPPRFGLSLLYSLWGPNRWRHLRFLRWKEAFETRKLFFAFLFAAVVVAFWPTSGFRNSSALTGFVAFFVLGASLCCGVMAFRKEQAGYLYQKLSDMGLNPHTVWFSKHLVWLVRAFLCCVVFLFGVVFVRLPGYGGAWHSSAWLFDEYWFRPESLSSTRSAFSPLAVAAGRVIIMVLTLYAIGQACSQLIRSSIVSVFVAFLLAMITFGWASACGYFGVPWALSVLPLAIGCLLVTCFRTRPWMLDDNRGRTWTLPAISIVAAITSAYVGTGLFRVYQVPWVAPVFVNANTLSGSSQPAGTTYNDGLNNEQRIRLLAPVTAKEEETFALYRRAAELLPTDSPETRETVLKILQEAAASPECAEFSPGDANLVTVADSVAGKTFTTVVSELLSDARREVDAGHPDIALDRYRTAFAICRHAAGRGEPDDFWNSHELSKKTLAAIQKWAGHTNVSTELFDQAITIIDEHREQMISLDVTNYATAVMFRNTLNADVLTMAELVGNSNRKMEFLFAMQFPGERHRCHRLLNLLESADAAAMAAFRSQQQKAKNGSANGMAGWVDQYAAGGGYAGPMYSDSRYLFQSTPAMAQLTRSVLAYRCQKDIITECEIRATKVMLQLLMERAESGTYPETLADFDAALNDPWSNRSFGWYPRGIEADLVTGSAMIMPSGTPFLMTTQGGTVGFVPGRLPPVESEFPPELIRDEQGTVVSQVVEANNVLQLSLSGRNDGMSHSSIWKLPAQVVTDEAE